ncbi:hypothetical protein Y023_5246 [Burkholderia pseudomallei A79D]|nr:hypothetical protein X992_5212 [Burkholderia pseudomallei MSHR5492]KGW87826.1 hypothetical protein Y030_2142 [Burkholderia pseudomallei MSHR332]KGX95835.1 hypothetical protein Y023_5246 [Burkholderia pseudomallei A79D]KGX96910.1 hypothetical protein X997_4926 [Burkholderia pseudomallei A79C]
MAFGMSFRLKSPNAKPSSAAKRCFGSIESEAAAFSSMPDICSINPIS